MNVLIPNGKRSLDEFSVEMPQADYGEKVMVKGQIPLEKKAPFEAFIENASKGGISLVFPAYTQGDC